MEELIIPEVLAGLEPYDLNPIERVLLAHTGTVQLLLSLWFKDTVQVRVSEQATNSIGTDRAVDLALASSGLVVCRANSWIPDAHNCDEVKELVEAEELGLGQIAVKLQINTVREIQELAVDEGIIWRRYIMSGKGLRYIITEEFPRGLYRWPTGLMKDPAQALTEAT